MEVKIPCTICSDESIGRYFGTYLCGSCKAFFRRNATRNEMFNCPFNGKCEINIMTRRHCRACRLEKCYKVGMKKEWLNSRPRLDSLIQTDHEFTSKEPMEVDMKPETSNTVNNNTTPHQQHQNNYTDDESDESSKSESTDEAESESEKCKTPIRKILDELLNEDVLENLLEEETAIMENQDITFNEDQNILTKPLREYQRSSVECFRVTGNTWDSREDPCDFHSSHKEYMTTTTHVSGCGNLVCFGNPFKSTADDKLKWHWKIYQKMIGANFTQLDFRTEFIPRRRALDTIEMVKFDELVKFGKLLCDSYEQWPTTLDVQGLFNIMEICLAKFVPGCNIISSFANLYMEDKQTLIKNSIVDIIMLRTSLMFDLETETVQVPRTSIVYCLKNLRKANNNVYLTYFNFLKSLINTWRTDYQVIVALIALLLFNPDAANIFYLDHIRVIQYNYMYLLRRYLEYRSPNICEARSDYFDLLMKIGELQETFNSRSALKDFALMHPHHVGPLLTEILDLR